MNKNVEKKTPNSCDKSRSTLKVVRVYGNRDLMQLYAEYVAAKITESMYCENRAA